MSKTIILNNRPVGMPTLDNFKFISEEIKSLNKGEIKVQAKYVSVDPYLRGRMSASKSYVAPFEVGKPITSGIVAEVITSENENFAVGDFISGILDWKEEQILTAETLKEIRKVDGSKIPLSAYLGVVGMTGLTAYLGLTQIGKPQKGETLLVSGAAGAVGSIVGQIGKILGLRVVGIAGSDEKVSLLKSEFGYDEGINYNSTEDMQSAIHKACPDGVDIYFDNVGGSISDAVLFSINKFARIIICGAISMYNETSLPTGISVQPFLVKNSALMQGFIVSNYQEKFPEAAKQLGTWLAENKLTYRETIVEGFDNIPQAFLDLFEGKNKGKMIVKV
ncbi:NADP-dependent oxidoreductase [Joostella sp. CR20]|uniref:NADP-dependent oxidoreductase n=1 Tax=Joostella sp. CR20 TaxID=2804312 RepID=UPI00313AA074